MTIISFMAGILVVVVIIAFLIDRLLLYLGRKTSQSTQLHQEDSSTRSHVKEPKVHKSRPL